jgi:hypothetical protein
MRRHFLMFCTAMVVAGAPAHAASSPADMARTHRPESACEKKAPRSMPEAAADTGMAAVPDLIALSDLTHPPGYIAVAGVRDSDGRMVGAVQRVVLAHDGAPARVAVAMLDDPGHLVSLDAARLRYDAKDNEIRLPQNLFSR